MSPGEPNMAAGGLAVPWAPSRKSKAWTRGAACVALVGFLFQCRAEVWSRYSAVQPRMPALWLEHRVSDGITSFVWCYSEAGAVLSGTGIRRSQSSVGEWDQGWRAFVGLAAACAAGAFIQSGVQNGASSGFGLAFLLLSAAFLWSGRKAFALGSEGEAAGRRTRR